MPRRPVTADDITKLVYPGDPQIHPSGKEILFSLKRVDPKKKYKTNLYSVDRRGKTTQVTQEETSASMGRWSPDGDRIAFVANRDEQGPQIYILPPHGEAKKVTKLPEGSISALKWSPDGKWLAFPFRETQKEFTKAASKERVANGGATPPRVYDDVWYRLDGDGYFGNCRYRLHLLNVATGKVKPLLPALPLDFVDFDWAPDSKRLVIIRPFGDHPLAGPPDSRLFLLDLEGNEKPISGQEIGDLSTPRWSPDGKSIAYFANLDPTDPWGVNNTRLYVTSVDGGAAKKLTDGDELDLAATTLSDTKDPGGELLEWAPDGKSLLSLKSFHGEQQLVRVYLDGRIEELTAGRHVLAPGSVSKDGHTVAAIFTDPTTPPEVAFLSADSKDAPKVVSKLNTRWASQVSLSKPEEAWVSSPDGTKVHAWVMRPSGGTGKLPAVLEIHGGPHAQYGWAYFHEFQLLAANGYVVAYSNPRGSKGYGEKHCAAIKGAWGDKDWQDVEAVGKWLRGLPGVDGKRVGVMGGSYGGYMTNWVVGHSNDFKSAITDRCVSNLVSMSGNSDFPLNPNGYFGGVPYGPLDDIKDLWRQSPIAYFKGVTTPMLVIHSEGDLRCNIEQGEQVYYALQMQGVKCRFARYPFETSHGLSRSGPADLRIHRLNEILRWWSETL